MLFMKKNAHMRSGVDSFEDRQEFNIDQGSTETMYQCIIDPAILQQFLLDVLLRVQQSSEKQIQFVQESSRNLVQVPQNMFTQMKVVPTLEVEEIEREEMPELYDPYSEQVMETELLKVTYQSYFDYSRAPNGPMKEEVIGDSSVIKMQKVGDEDDIGG